MRGSILGVGTDIGGAICIPALCCGTYGFKPSSNRIPYGGQQGPGKAGSPGIKAAAGPLATSFRDLEYFTQLILSQSPWNHDSSAMAIPWRATTTKTKLIIGVQVDEPIHPLFPSVARALSSAIKKLEAAGHSIIYLKDAPTAAEALTIASHFFSLDNSKVRIFIFPPPKFHTILIAGCLGFSVLLQLSGYPSCLRRMKANLETLNSNG
jgi:amidase